MIMIMFRNVYMQGMRLCEFCRGFKLRSAYFSTVRNMASDTDHLTRTADNTRHKVIATAKVREVENLSSTVKRLHLYVPDQNFTFKAGQWVDMFIPGVETVGGFSMCSAPDLLTRTRILHLAVKFANHPPAYWVHKQCQPNDKVHLRAGGDFYYDPQPGMENNDLLLLAGGVGINPLYSMLQHFLYLHSMDCGDSNLVHGASVTLLYSARNTEELIFQNELIRFTDEFKNVKLKMYSTREPVIESPHITEGRIRLRDIQWALSTTDKTKTDVFICGPLSFIEAMKLYCRDSGISDEKVFYEKWW